MFQKAVFPGKYIQGVGAMSELPALIALLGKQGLVLASPTSKDKVLPRCGIDPDGTGELPSTADAIEAVVSTVLACAPITPSMKWRVTALRERGIDPDEWCTSKPGRVSLQITRNGEG